MAELADGWAFQSRCRLKNPCRRSGTLGSSAAAAAHSAAHGASDGATCVAEDVS